MIKQITFFSLTTLLIVALASCSMQATIVPQAINTVNSVSLEELNLQRKDYTILNTTTVESTIIYHESFKNVTITEANDEFSLTFTLAKDGKFYLTAFRGIAKFGFLKNDYGETLIARAPEYIARNLAIYRLINACKANGADGVIEPVISTNVEQSRRGIVFKTTASAKLLKLKPDGK
ncbi:MAG: hypothetical protein IJS05_03530 [Paludibacteraceae bacterium]|nr:hypothetical protein [Paludibacteraceae bacterium]